MWYICPTCWGTQVCCPMCLSHSCSGCRSWEGLRDPPSAAFSKKYGFTLRGSSGSRIRVNSPGEKNLPVAPNCCSKCGKWWETGSSFSLSFGHVTQVLPSPLPIPAELLFCKLFFFRITFIVSETCWMEPTKQVWLQLQHVVTGCI